MDGADSGRSGQSMCGAVVVPGQHDRVDTQRRQLPDRFSGLGAKLIADRDRGDDGAFPFDQHDGGAVALQSSDVSGERAGIEPPGFAQAQLLSAYPAGEAVTGDRGDVIGR